MPNDTDRYAAFPQRIAETVLRGPGRASIELRRAVEARAATLGGRPGAAEQVTEPFAAYVDQIARRAAEITAADVDALRQAGQSDDVVYEVTVAAALGAALARLERGLAALRGT